MQPPRIPCNVLIMNSYSTDYQMSPLPKPSPVRVARRSRSLSHFERSSERTPSPYEPSDWLASSSPPAPLRDVLKDLDDCTLEKGTCHPAVHVADLWNSLGLIRFHMQHNVRAAIKCHQTALEIYRTTKSYFQVAVCLADLAACYEKQQESKKSISLYREALSLLEKIVDKPKKCLQQSICRCLARLERN